jgi:hypothetical protein
MRAANFQILFLYPTRAGYHVKQIELEGTKDL